MLMNVRIVIIHDVQDEITSLKRLLMQEGYEVVAIPLKMDVRKNVLPRDIYLILFYTPSLTAVLAGVKAQVNAGVQFSITGTYTDSVTYNIPPGKSIGVTYGVTRQIAYGDYTYLSNYCVTTDYGYQESWSPWRLEWLKVAGNL
jgi:hypothetical protein